MAAIHDSPLSTGSAFYSLLNGLKECPSLSALAAKTSWTRMLYWGILAAGASYIACRGLQRARLQKPGSFASRTLPLITCQVQLKKLVLALEWNDHRPSFEDIKQILQKCKEMLASVPDIEELTEHLSMRIPVTPTNTDLGSRLNQISWELSILRDLQGTLFDTLLQTAPIIQDKCSDSKEDLNFLLTDAFEKFDRQVETLLDQDTYGNGCDSINAKSTEKYLTFAEVFRNLQNAEMEGLALERVKSLVGQTDASTLTRLQTLCSLTQYYQRVGDMSAAGSLIDAARQLDDQSARGSQLTGQRLLLARIYLCLGEHHEMLSLVQTTRLEWNALEQAENLDSMLCLLQDIQNNSDVPEAIKQSLGPQPCSDSIFWQLNPFLAPTERHARAFLSIARAYRKFPSNQPTRVEAITKAYQAISTLPINTYTQDEVKTNLWAQLISFCGENNTQEQEIVRASHDCLSLAVHENPSDPSDPLYALQSEILQFYKRTTQTEELDLFFKKHFLNLVIRDETPFDAITRLVAMAKVCKHPLTDQKEALLNLAQARLSQLPLMSHEYKYAAPLIAEGFLELEGQAGKGQELLETYRQNLTKAYGFSAMLTLITMVALRFLPYPLFVAAAALAAGRVYYLRRGPRI